MEFDILSVPLLPTKRTAGENANPLKLFSNEISTEIGRVNGGSLFRPIASCSNETGARPIMREVRAGILLLCCIDRMDSGILDRILRLHALVRWTNL